MKARFRYLLRLFLLPVLLSVLGVNAVWAQAIAPDSDTHTVISSPDSNPNQFDITGGTRAGGNLFHSFQRFELSQGQTANFLSNSGIQNILGRVTGGNASMINGLIQVTGGNSNLLLMNPAGILFGPQARLNVPAAFMATTANSIWMGSGWFNATGPNTYSNLTGTPDNFAFLGNTGAILNAGILTANPGQRITLLGGVVLNTGTILVPEGNITIAAVPGQQLVRIAQTGSLLSLLLPTATATAINAPTGSPLSLPALLTGGSLPAATGIAVENGIIRLTSNGREISTETGSATVSGSLSTASTVLANTSQIQVLGDRVALLNANLNASGVSGGMVRIGGDYQGSAPLPSARFTEVDAHTLVQADAITSLPNRADGTGNGGTVIVWSTDTTRFAGTITVQGGTNGGNGGLVETSGKQTLIVSPTASVSTRAPWGQTGIWLLDPPELTVETGGTGILAGGPPLTNIPTTATTISAAAIVTGLNGSHVNLQAREQITVNAAIDASTNPIAGVLTLTTLATTLNQPIILRTGSTLSGTAAIVNVNAGGRIQNGVDVATAGATVNVAAGTFHIPGVMNQLSITKPLTVQGTGAENTIVDGGGNSRGVYVDPGTGKTVTLDGLTIQNGYASSGAGILLNSGTLNLANSSLTGNLARYGGGGIYNYGGRVNLTNSSLSGNLAAYGGGIYNDSGTANLINSILSGNLVRADVSDFNRFFSIKHSYGGGIYNNNGTVNLANSLLIGNSAGTDGSGYNYGGGIYNDSGRANLTNSSLISNSAGADGRGGGIHNNGGTVELTNSTLSSNLATNGGGIYNGGHIAVHLFPRFNYVSLASGTVTLTNSTLIGNSAADSGGGIYNETGTPTGDNTIAVNNSTLTSNLAGSSGGGIYNASIVKVSNSTIAKNSAESGGGVFSSEGIFNVSTFTVRNSIIAGNNAFSGRELINLGNSTSEGYNLFGFNRSSGVERMALRATDIVPSVDITHILAPLSNYGGPTQTHALVPGSPAINMGDPRLLTPDQRGFVRFGRADIGAFEFQDISLPSFSLGALNKIRAALLVRKIDPMTIEFQSIPFPSILCVVRSQRREAPGTNVYPADESQVIPDCPP